MINIKIKQSKNICYLISHSGTTKLFPNYEGEEKEFFSGRMFGMSWNEKICSYDFEEVILSKPIYWEKYKLVTHTYYFEDKNSLLMSARLMLYKKFLKSLAIVEIQEDGTQKVIYKRY